MDTWALYLYHLELIFSKIMQYEVDKRIYFELISNARVEMHMVSCCVHEVKDVSNQHEEQT